MIITIDQYKNQIKVLQCVESIKLEWVSNDYNNDYDLLVPSFKITEEKVRNNLIIKASICVTATIESSNLVKINVTHMDSKVGEYTIRDLVKHGLLKEKSRLLSYMKDYVLF